MAIYDQFLMYFFFSSRRRHTRWTGDWSSDVCSSDLEAKQRAEAEAARILVAETEAKLAQIARQQQEAEAEAELNRQRRAVEQARIQAETARQARDRAAADARAQREQEARERAQLIVTQAAISTSASSDKPAVASGAASTSVAAITGPRAKKQAEVEVVLARMVEANDPEAVSLKWIQERFDLKQTTAYDRLVTAQRLYEKAKNQKSA